MGVYIMKVIKSNPVVIDGLDAPAHRVMFAYKPVYWGWDSESVNRKFHRRFAAHAERAWGCELPKYVVDAFGDGSVRSGCRVFESPSTVTFYDTLLDRKPLGLLVVEKVGRKKRYTLKRTV